jgi:hypothetical protein
MLRGAPDVDSPQDVPIAMSEVRRERVVVRRRRARSRRRSGSGIWTTPASRRKVIRAFVVCTGVLLLMGLGLYFGLSRQDTAPSERSRKASAMIASVG